MHLLILEPTSKRVNYLVLSALDQRGFPPSESREIMLLVDGSLPRELKSDLSLPYSAISLIFTINYVILTPQGKDEEKKTRGEKQKTKHQKSRLQQKELIATHQENFRKLDRKSVV